MLYTSGEGRQEGERERGREGGRERGREGGRGREGENVSYYSHDYIFPENYWCKVNHCCVATPCNTIVWHCKSASTTAKSTNQTTYRFQSPRASSNGSLPPVTLKLLPCQFIRARTHDITTAAERKEERSEERSGERSEQRRRRAAEQKTDKEEENEGKPSVALVNFSLPRLKSAPSPSPL